MIDLCIDIAVLNLYGGVTGVSAITLEPAIKVITLCIAHSISLPSADPVIGSSIRDYNGWGFHFSRGDLLKGFDT